MKLFTGILLFICGAVFGTECEVCVTFLGKAEQALKEEKIGGDLGKIEAKLRSMCAENKNDKDGRFCYYTGLSADSATTMHLEIVKPMSFHKPVNKICDKLKKLDPQICDLKYPKPYNYAEINWKKIKVKELKKILGDWGETCKNCLEKSEFVARVKELLPKHVPKENWPKDEL